MKRWYVYFNLPSREESFFLCVEATDAQDAVEEMIGQGKFSSVSQVVAVCTKDWYNDLIVECRTGQTA